MGKRDFSTSKVHFLSKILYKESDEFIKSDNFQAKKKEKKTKKLKKKKNLQFLCEKTGLDKILTQFLALKKPC